MRPIRTCHVHVDMHLRDGITFQTNDRIVCIVYIQMNAGALRSAEMFGLNNECARDSANRNCEHDYSAGTFGNWLRMVSMLPDADK